VLIGLVVGLGLRSPSLIGLGLGLGLRSPTWIGLWFGLGLRKVQLGIGLWTLGPKIRALVKSAAGGSDFCFGLGLRALPWLSSSVDQARGWSRHTISQSHDHDRARG
jgi:hypothetical protein